MRVLHVVGGLDPNAGGPSRSVAGLCKGLSEIGGDVALFVHDPFGLEHADVGGCRVFHGHGMSAPRKICREDFVKVITAWRPDLVHIHGIWNLFLHDDIKICVRRNIPYIIAPRGSLDAWSLRQKWLKKTLALWLYQRRDLRHAVAIHTTAEMETGYVRAQGCTQNIIQSPNGVNMPKALPLENRASNVKRALFLSRMNAKKGVLDLVEAWARVRPRGWQCELVYTVGNDMDRRYEISVKRRIAELSLGGDFILTGPMTNEKKWEAYRRADAFILPTYTENFGIVIAEALYAGIPVLTTKGGPWRGLIDYNCGWWTDVGVGPVADALREMTGLDRETLHAMGLRGHEYVVKEFHWKNLAARMWNDYKVLLGNA